MHKFGLIGHPIQHSQSPALFRQAYAGRYEYDLIETPDFDTAWDRFLKEYHGINITAPFKALAAERADIMSDEVKAIGAANIAVHTPDGIKVHNSDYLGLLGLIQPFEDVAVIGFGGAGKAAVAAAEGAGKRVRLYRHDGLAGGVEADLVIFTLPKAVEGQDRIRCRALLEANYRDPVFSESSLAPFGTTYIPGMEWLKAQAMTGYELLTGEKPMDL